MKTFLDVLPAAAFAGGAVAIVVGAAQVFVPAGWIVGGLIALGCAVVSELR